MISKRWLYGEKDYFAGVTIEVTKSISLNLWFLDLDIDYDKGTETPRWRFSHSMYSRNSFDRITLKSTYKKAKKWFLMKVLRMRYCAFCYSLKWFWQIHDDRMADIQPPFDTYPICTKCMNHEYEAPYDDLYYRHR